MSKIHLYSGHTTRRMPVHLLSLYSKQGLSGTACGYMSKNVVSGFEAKSVTCAHCLREIKRASSEL